MYRDASYPLLTHVFTWAKVKEQNSRKNKFGTNDPAGSPRRYYYSQSVIMGSDD